VTSSVVAFEAAIRLKSIYRTYYATENKKKEKIYTAKKFTIFSMV